MTPVYVRGDGIYFWLNMPEAPRKGDILWLSSLTRGACDVQEAVVSRVSWSMDQTSGIIGAWVTVRRQPKRNSHEVRTRAEEALETPEESR